MSLTYVRAGRARRAAGPGDAQVVLVATRLASVVGVIIVYVVAGAWSQAPRQRRWTSRRTRSVPLP